MIRAVFVALAAVLLGGYHIRYVTELADQNAASAVRITELLDLNSALLRDLQAANDTIVSTAAASDSVLRGSYCCCDLVESRSLAVSTCIS